ncbi:hypothetical protein [Nocardia sp. NPDC005825]|uniref:hypothetical protein n=1 Tax=unclassified Nocardia TaxID=2637762 RepID=UPI0033D3719A
METANSVSRWTSLGVELPKSLAGAIDVFDALQYVEIGHRPVFDLSKVTAANAEAELKKYAAEYIFTIETTNPLGGRVSPLSEAKRDAVDTAAGAVVRAAVDAVPGIVSALEPALSDAAHDYADAVAKLPDEITSENLVAAGAFAVAAYSDALEALRRISVAESWVASIANLPGHGGRPDRALSVFKPETFIQLSRLDSAHVRDVDQAHKALNPVMVAGVRNSVPFGLNTPADAARLRRELETVRM